MIGFSCLEASPKAILENELDASQVLTLKWVQRVGKSTFKTNILFVNHTLLFPSNGRSALGAEDNLDGLYLIDPKNGAIKNQLHADSRDDTDVNGVAASPDTIFFTSDSNEVYAYTWLGEKLWSRSCSDHIEGNPALADLNGDGVVDLSVAVESGQLLALDGLTGKNIWAIQVDYKPSWTYPEKRSFIASPALKDLDGDGIRDVLIGSRNGTFYAFNGKNGVLLWEMRSVEPSGIHASAIVKDDMITWAESYHRVHHLDLKGNILWRKSLLPEGLPSLFSSPILSSSNTLVIGSSLPQQKSGAWVLPESGEQRFYPLGKISSSAVVADFLGLGTLQIGLVSESGIFAIFSEKGDILARFILECGSEATPFVGDIDEDGVLDLLIAGTDGTLYCYTLPSKGEVFWGSFRGNPFNTGVVNDELDFGVHDHAPHFGFRLMPYQVLTDLFLISEDGIGAVRVGMSYGKIKKLMRGLRFEEVDLGVGMKAMAIKRGEVSELYLFYPSWAKLQDTDIITTIGTDNPNYRMQDGIHVGNSIKDLEAKLGKVRLIYTDRQGMETISFEKKPAQIWFANFSKQRLGIYAVKQSQFNGTGAYQNEAILPFIGVKKLK